MSIVKRVSSFMNLSRQRHRHWIAAAVCPVMAMTMFGRGDARGVETLARIAAAPSPHPDLMQSAVVPDSDLVADVQLYYPHDSSHASIPVVMGGTSWWLDVDLGAESGLLWPAARKALDAHVGLLGGTMVSGYGGETPAEQVSVDSVKVGSVTRTSLTFLVMDLETQMHLTPSKVHPISGIIGRSYFASYDLVFDFPAQRFRMYTTQDSARGVARTKGMTCVKNRMSDRTEMIIVPITVNGQRSSGFLDTGARLTTLDWELAQKIGVTPTSKGVKPVDTWSGGVGGEIKEYTVPGVRLTVDGTPLRDRVLRFGREIMPTSSSLEDADQPHVILGLNSISDRVLLISWSTNQVCLGPRSTAK